MPVNKQIHCRHGLERWRIGLFPGLIYGLALFLVGTWKCPGGDELEHRHLVYTVARTVGFDPADAEVISAASWSMDKNDSTVATPSDSESAKLREMVAGSAPAGKDPAEEVNYYARGLAFHALASDEARKEIRGYFEKEIKAAEATKNRHQILVQEGMFLHFLVDTYVHPRESLGGHWWTHANDYAKLRPDEYQEATKDVYRSLRQIYLDTHPTQVAELTKREALFGTAHDRLDTYSKDVVDALAAAYPKSTGVRAIAGLDVNRLTTDAKANLSKKFTKAFGYLGEPPLAVPEFKKITFSLDGSGKIAFSRPGKDSVKGSLHDPSYEIQANTAHQFSNAREQLSAERRTLTKVCEAAREVPTGGLHPIELAQNGAMRMVGLPQSQMQKLKEQEAVGGVKLDIVFDFLSELDVPVVREGHVIKSVRDPQLVSLKNLTLRTRQGTPAKTWPSDPEVISLGGLTRLYGYLLDEDSADIILIGERESGVAPIGLENFVVALQNVYRDGVIPAVSLDPRREDPGGLQYSRVLGIEPNSAFAKIMLDADYAMKRVMLGVTTVQGISGFKSFAEIAAGNLNDFSVGSRFWFHPMRFRSQDIRTSAAGDLILFDSKLQVLTQEITFAADGIKDVDGKDGLAEEAADNFTEHIPELEEQVRYQGRLVFKELHGLLDVTTLASIWRLAGQSELLGDLMALPVPAREVPLYYEGVSRMLGQVGNTVVGLHGGVEIRRLLSSRLFDSYEDVQTRQLRAAAQRLSESGDMSGTALGVVLQLAQSPAEQGDPVELAMRTGIQSLRGGQYENAVKLLSSAIERSPEVGELFALRAVAFIQLQQSTDAERDVSEARRLSPENEFVSKAEYLLGVMLHRDRSLKASAPLSRRLREYMSLRGERLLMAHDTQQAEESLTQALNASESEPYSAFILHIRRGYIREAAGDFNGARHDYLEADKLFQTEKQFSSDFDWEWYHGYDQLLMAKGWLQLSMGNYDEVLSKDSEFSYPAMNADIAIRLEAHYAWAVAKCRALMEQRQQRLNAGIPISHAWSSHEIDILRNSVRDLTKELADAPVAGATSDRRETLERQINELVGTLKERISKIEKAELDD